MSRKDYFLIAGAIRDEVEKWGGLTTDEERRMARAIADSIADALMRDNDAFRRELFLSACGFEV